VYLCFSSNTLTKLQFLIALSADFIISVIFGYLINIFWLCFLLFLFSQFWL
jgi:hypothetical protein